MARPRPKSGQVSLPPGFNSDSSNFYDPEGISSDDDADGCCHVIGHVQFG